jgi:hypothetical protein
MKKGNVLFGIMFNQINLVCTIFYLVSLKTFWTNLVRVCTHEESVIKRRVKRCKNSDLKEISNTRFKALKNLYRAELITAKQDSWKKFCTDSTKHSPWKLYKTRKTGFARTPVPTSLTLLDGSETTSEVETASALQWPSKGYQGLNA